MTCEEQYEWAACIISSRENIETLLSTLRATYSACQNKHSIIDLIINGNPCLTSRITKELDLNNTESVKIRLWSIEESDKANALNQYMHRIWPYSGLTFFIDGYAQPWPDAFHQIDDKLLHNKVALAATAVPTDGHSANYLRKIMISEGGIHGNLFAIKKDTLSKIREINFKLPLGLYRTDPTIAAAIAFNFDPSTNIWNVKDRVLVVQEASWSLPKECSKSLTYFVRKFNTFANRKIRQARGQMENLAVKEHLSVLKRKPEDLPENTKALLKAWLKNNLQKSALFFILHPLCLYAYFKINSDYDENKLTPKCVTEGYLHNKNHEN